MQTSFPPMSALTRMVLDYQQSGEGYDRIVEEVSQIAAQFFNTQSRETHDNYADVFVDLLEGLRNLLSRFRYCGTPFEIFFRQLLCWRWTDVKRKRANRSIMYKNALAESYYELSEKTYAYRADRQPDILCEKPTMRIRGKVEAGKTKTRMLICFLRSANQVSEEHIARFAEFTGFALPDLRRQVDYLRKKTARKLEKKEALCTRRDYLFSRVRYLEERIATCSIPELTHSLKMQLGRAKKWLLYTWKLLNRLSICPNMRDIAELLDIPIGTVGSSLHYLRYKVPSRKDEELA